MSGETRSLGVPEGLDGERLDRALARLFGLSRSKAAELIVAERVVLDGSAAVKSDRVHAGGWLEVELPPASGPEMSAAGQDDEDQPSSGSVPTLVEGVRIVHDDPDIVVVDKPVGVAAHPSPGWTGPSVVGHLAAAGFRIATSGAAERQGIVHRLDVGTSGLMVLAKSERAYAVLKQAFRDREVEKIYHALVQGHPDPTRGTVDAPIGRHPTLDYKWAVVAGGKPAVTHYEMLEAFRHVSLVRVQLETGRTHQIRVHMSAVRHPCAGDLTYGADPVLAERLGLARQWLHATQLAFIHPGSGTRAEFEAPYPDDLATALDLAAT